MALLRSKGAQVLGMSPHFTVWPRSGAQEFIAFLLGANPRNRKRLHAEAGPNPGLALAQPGRVSR